jgi:rhodanese-related sulfurtransferase
MGVVVLAILAAGVVVFYLARNYYRRRAFLRELQIARMSPLELKEKLDRQEPIAIIDLRHSLDFLPEPYTLPGALRIPLEELDKRSAEIPRDRELVLYCTCPDEASSILTARKLRRLGIVRVHPLQGGLRAWRELGFPLQSELASEQLVNQVACPLCQNSTAQSVSQEIRPSSEL